MSERAERREIGELIAKRRGELIESVPSTNYLLVGNAGNPAWAFSCYGRKVEAAMTLRKQGRPIIIVNEIDFWDAMVD